MPFIVAAEGVTSTLGSVITSNMVQGVLNEIIALLPVMMPAMIGFIAIRKGISFVRGILQSA